MARGLTKPGFTIAFVIAVAFALLVSHVADSREEKRLASTRDQAPAAVANHDMQSGQMVVVNVPIVSAKGFTENQTCFVWRDYEYKSSSLQCPNDRQSYSLDPPQK